MKWFVPREWAGQTCVVIAGGSSMGNVRTGQYFDLSPLADAQPRPKVITVNDAWRLYPSANVCYFCDASWWNSQVSADPWSVDKSVSFSKMIYRAFWVTAGPTPPDHPQIRTLKLTGQRGFEPCPHSLRHGSNSGYQAIHLAVHFGVTKIILVGFDMKVGADGRTHWHNESRQPARAFGQTLAGFVSHFPSLAEPLRERGITVINSTPDSALTIWPHLPLKEALNGASTS